MRDPDSPSFVLGIVGAGIMGRGIAQIAAEAGLRVLFADARREAVDEAVAATSAMIRRGAEKGRLTSDAAEAAAARLLATDAGPETGWAAFADCDLVIEAVVERMEVKHAVLAGLEGVVRDDCVVATNTSSLSVTGFASAARRPERVAGFHFFNPVPLMRVVEVIGGVLTDPAVVDGLARLARRMGHRAVVATDTPGFLVNHAGRGYGTEALRIVQEGVADFAAVDRIMTEAAGFRMGPFELFDLTGLDVSQTVMESIYHQYYEEPRYRPSPIGAQRRTAGLFGRKTGRGFYAYLDGRRLQPAEPAVPAMDVAAPSVWIAADEPEVAETLARLVRTAGATIETGDRPSDTALILLAPLGEDATGAAVRRGVDARRAVAIDSLTPLDRRRTVATTPVTDPSVRDAAHALLAADGTPVTVVRDSAGFVAQRILAAIVNVGCDIAQQRVATPADVDAAVELGLGYPRGPLKLGDHLGPDRVLRILEGLLAHSGDPRWRPSPWLKRRALLGVSLTTPE
ncbi:MAG: 3-hydroxyacyl-CoA dehydrogenase [Siculibacillus sp.]